MNLTFSKGKSWAVLVPAMTLPFLASVFYFKLYSDNPLAQLLYAGTKFFTLVWPLIGSYLFFRVWIPGFQLRHSIHRAALLPGILSGLGIVAIMVVGLHTVIGDVVVAHGSIIRDKLAELHVLNYYIPFAIFLSFFHSLLEEYYWRFFVYGHLALLVPRPWAHGLAAVAFASHHVIVLDEYFPTPWALFFGASVGLGGLLWSVMYQQQKTLAGAWVSHMIVDIGLLTIGYLVIF